MQLAERFDEFTLNYPFKIIRPAQKSFIGKTPNPTTATKMSYGREKERNFRNELMANGLDQTTQRRIHDFRYKNYVLHGEIDFVIDGKVVEFKARVAAKKNTSVWLADVLQIQLYALCLNLPSIVLIEEFSSGERAESIIPFDPTLLSKL